MKKLFLGFLIIPFLWFPVQFETLATSEVSQVNSGIDRSLSSVPISVLDRLFTESSLNVAWFDPVFLRQIPLSELEKILGQIRQTMGTYQTIREAGNDYLIVFERGSIPTQLRLNDQGKIIYLLFRPPVGNTSSWETIVQQLQELSGSIGFLATRNGEAIAQLHSDRALAVGSAFKLAVLAALQQEIEAGNLAWDDAIELQSQWQSLPTGILQDWQAGFPVTVHSLATLMISLSDNTATDALISLLGREKVEAFSPRNRPFLTTREAFILKNPENQEFLQQYREGNEAEKRGVLRASRSAALPNVNVFTGNPIALDVEWFFTSRELCALMGEVGDLPLMSVNPGIANADRWQKVSFKGGSESGVLNFTTQLVDETGDRYCLSLTWNDDRPLDEVRLLTIYSSAIATLQGS